MRTIILSLIMMSLMICAPGAYAGKGYWTADDTLFQQICVHITYLSMGLIPFVVRTAQTIKIMELTHDGPELCLGWVKVVTVRSVIT
jgi:hypothetical protein